MFFERDASQTVEMLPGIQRRTVSYGERMHAVHFTIQAGSTLPVHSHPHEQIGLVLSGVLELTIGDEGPRRLEPGAGYAIPGGVPHGAFFPVDTEVVDIFSPPREEYLD